MIYCFFDLLIAYLGGERSLLITLHGRPPKYPVFPGNILWREVDVSDPYTFLFLKRGVLRKSRRFVYDRIIYLPLHLLAPATIHSYIMAGYVTHGTDRALWALRLPVLEDDQASVARKWLSAIPEYVKRAEEGDTLPLKTIVALTEDQEIREVEDTKWDEHMRLRKTLPGEI